MAYRNGRDVLPAELLVQLQKYIEGEIIYIPRKDEGRLGWGEASGTRKMLDKRNREIYSLYKNGVKMKELVERFHLSEDSIRKILCKVSRSVEIY